MSSCPNEICHCPHCPDESYKKKLTEFFLIEMGKNRPFNRTFYPREIEYIFRALKEKEINDENPNKTNDAINIFFIPKK